MQDLHTHFHSEQYNFLLKCKEEDECKKKLNLKILIKKNDELTYDIFVNNNCIMNL